VKFGITGNTETNTFVQDQFLLVAKACVTERNLT